MIGHNTVFFPFKIKIIQNLGLFVFIVPGMARGVGIPGELESRFPALLSHGSPLKYISQVVLQLGIEQILPLSLRSLQIVGEQCPPNRKDMANRIWPTLAKALYHSWESETLSLKLWWSTLWNTASCAMQIDIRKDWWTQTEHQRPEGKTGHSELSVKHNGRGICRVQEGEGYK